MQKCESLSLTQRKKIMEVYSYKSQGWQKEKDIRGVGEIRMGKNRMANDTMGKEIMAKNSKGI